MINFRAHWKSALTTASGERWRYIRHTLSPTFSTGKLKYVSIIYYLNLRVTTCNCVQTTDDANSIANNKMVLHLKIASV